MIWRVLEWNTHECHLVLCITMLGLHFILKRDLGTMPLRIYVFWVLNLTWINTLVGGLAFGLLSIFSGLWCRTPPFPTSHPKLSQECYKLTGQGDYKLTNSRLPKEDAPSDRTVYTHWTNRQGWEVTSNPLLCPQGRVTRASCQHSTCSWPGWATFHWKDSALQSFESKVLAL